MFECFNTPRKQTLQVQSCGSGYGITDGNGKWFYYAFPSLKQAEQFLTQHSETVSVFENVEKIAARLTYDRPQSIFFYRPINYRLLKARKILSLLGWVARGFRCGYCRERCNSLRYPESNKPMCNTCYYDPDRYAKTGA